MANEENNSAIDFNKIIADIVVQNEERWVKGLKGFLLDKYKKAGVKYSYSFEQYLTRAYEKYSKVKTILYKNEPRYLYDFFVYNSITQTGLNRKTKKQINCSSVQNVMNLNKYTTILGSGGTGKSILMKHFFISALIEGKAIPIFAELRNFSSSEQIESFLYRIISNLGFNLEIEYFEYALKNGTFLILFDGYDEMSTNVQKEFYKQIDIFCDKYPSNYLIVSSRPCDDFYGWQRFSIYNAMPLSKTQAMELVNKIDYDTEIKNKFLSRLETDLYESHKSFASNPLLLSIMLMTFDNFADIPEKRHIFYSNAFDTLYSIHDATKGGYKRDLKSGLSSQEFKKVFSCFCFMTYLGDNTEFTRDKLLDFFQSIIYKPANFDKEAYIEDLVSSVCLLYLEGTNYIFTHRSFQEYFTALYLLQMNDEEQKNACQFILNYCEGTLRTDSVFEMLFDMNPDRFEQNFALPTLEKVLATASIDSDDPKKVFSSFVKEIRIASIRDLIESEDMDADQTFIFPIAGFEKTDNLISVSFNEGIYPHFLFFLGTHYPELKKKYPKPIRLPIKYFAKSYSAADVIRDPTLFTYITNIRLIDLVISTPVLLLNQIKERQEKKKLDENRLYKQFLSFGKGAE